MRAVLVLVIVVLLLSAVGWLVFSADEDEATIRVRTGEMKEAAEEVVDETREAFRQAGREIEDFVNEDDDVEIDVDDEIDVNAVPADSEFDEQPDRVVIPE